MLRKINLDDYEFAVRLLPRLKKSDLSVYALGSMSFVIEDDGQAVGILLSSLLWERIPFLQHLVVAEGSRGRGIGS